MTAALITLAVFGSQFLWDIYAHCEYWMWVQTYLKLTDATVFFSLWRYMDFTVVLWLYISDLVYVWTDVFWFFPVDRSWHYSGFRWFYADSILDEWYDNSISLHFQKLMCLLFCFFLFTEDWIVYILDPFFWILEFTWMWIYWM